MERDELSGVAAFLPEEERSFKGYDGAWPFMTSSALGCARMKNETESNTSDIPTKEQVIETVIDISFS